MKFVPSPPQQQGDFPGAPAPGGPEKKHSSASLHAWACLRYVVLIIQNTCGNAANLFIYFSLLFKKYIYIYVLRFFAGSPQ